MKKEDVILINATYEEVLDYDELGVRRGTHSKVRVNHKICEPVKQAFPPIVYEFGSQRVPATLVITGLLAFVRRVVCWRIMLPVVTVLPTCQSCG